MTASNTPLNPTPSLSAVISAPSVMIPSLPSHAVVFVVAATTSSKLQSQLYRQPQEGEEVNSQRSPAAVASDGFKDA